MEMNLNKLNEIISKYKEDFAVTNKEEIYKWQAVKCFQEHWDINAENFSEMLNKALGKSANLLAAQNFYPKKMICLFAEKDPQAVREMFAALYDETVSAVERIDNFRGSSDALLQKYGEGMWQNHYQTANTISIYLFFRYPGKYYIYKFKKFKAFAAEISYQQPMSKGATERVQDYFDMCNEINSYILQDGELLEMSKNRLGSDEYSDEEFHLLTDDIIYFGSHKGEGSNEWWPSEKDYNPGINAERWLELLENRNVFTEDSLAIMKRLLDSGGEATCTQLSERYGEAKNFYNIGSSSLARRVWKESGCALLTQNNDNSKWWPILFVGRHAGDTKSSGYIWRLRPELKEALEKFDLSSVPLYKEKVGEEEINYWWLNANPKIWSLSSLRTGEEENYTLVNENGNKRRIYQNFLDAKAGDMVIGYESTPTRQVVAICKISRENDGANIFIEKIEGLSAPVDYSVLKEIDELKNMEYFINPQGSLFKLTKEEYDIIMDVVREHNPIPQVDKLQPYSKENFLSEVYMDEGEYDKLVSLLEQKKNIILQGAPGVGKTFAAKRLAYSIIGSIDDEKVKLVQFHQNYSYEDFIMGYKPYEDGFKLQTGIFYQFCQAAENNPDDKYFFIIDEINRGNMSKIFGELLMLIEKDYRGEKMTLAYNGMTFFVPENLYIIGMMNTADRSLAMIDYALRRRFSFYNMVPAFYNEGFKSYQKKLGSETLDNIIEQVKELNQVIANDASLGEGFCIGHSYFCGQQVCTDEWLSEVVEYDLIPMLKEYWFDEKSKADTWINRLHGAIYD